MSGYVIPHTIDTSLLTTHFTLRHWRSAWRSTALLALILALGVGVFLAIRLANRAALSGFTIFTETVTGESDLVLRPASGDFPTATLSEIRDALNPLPIAIFPVVESTAAEYRPDREANAVGPAPPFQLVGIDLVALPNVFYLGQATTGRPSTSEEAPAAGNTPSLLGSPNHASISQSLAKERGLQLDDSLSLIVDDRIVEIIVSGILPDDPLRAEVPRNLLLFDLPGLQALLSRPDGIDRVELKVPPGDNRDRYTTEATERLERFVEGRNLLLETPATKKATATQMTAAFRLNLTVLSTLALLVGTYLILQALEASVVRRREEIAILRSLGVTPREIQRAWFREALALGILGSALGVPLGWGMAQLAVGSIARTVNAVYYSTTTDAADLHLGETALAFGFGVLASVLAGLLPARDAASTPPAQALRAGQRNVGIRALRLPWLGLAVAIVALFLAQLEPLRSDAGTHIPLGGYFAALLWVIAISILAGLLFRPVAALIRSFRESPAAIYAGSHLLAPTGRHRLTVAGLLTAIGMAAGMGILIFSFETTLTGWINQLLRADLYVTTGGSGNASNTNQLRSETWRSILDDPDVDASDQLRIYPLSYLGSGANLAGATYTDTHQRLQLTWVDPPKSDDPRTLRNVSEGIIPAWTNESFTLRHAHAPGDIVPIQTPDGEKRLRIEGVYADYGNESGTLLVDRSFTRDWFQDDRLSSLALYLKNDADPEIARARLAEAHPALLIRTNSRLRAEAIRLFHETFAVTYALEAIGIGVAITGLALALVSLLLERRREITTLKSLGYDRRGIAIASILESLGLAAIGSIGGIALSLVMGHLLIHVINRQSFGWTLQFSVPWLSLSGIVLATLATAALVAWPIGLNAAKLRSEQEE